MRLRDFGLIRNVGHSATLYKCGHEHFSDGVSVGYTDDVRAPKAIAFEVVMFLILVPQTVSTRRIHPD